MIFLGKPIDAKRAYEIGLVNKLVPNEELMETALELAKQLCEKPPLSLAKAKKAINAAWSTDLYSGMEMEANEWADVYSTEDQKEGMKAFIEKRRPNFKGR